MREWFDLLRATSQQARAEDVERHAAALAFYSAVSIAPLLHLLTVIAATFTGADAAAAELERLAATVMGPEAAAHLRVVFETADRLEPGAVARLAEVVVLVWGSTRLFLELQASLNAVWGLQPRRPTARSLLRSRMLAFALVVTLSFMLVVSLAFSAAVTSLVTAFPVLDASSPAIAWLVRNGLLFVGVATAFTFMYRVIPDTVVQWRVAAGGAAVTALFFVVATELLKLITAGKGAPYGASGSFVVYLLWVYGSARAALFGAVLSQNYAARRILK